VAINIASLYGLAPAHLRPAARPYVTPLIRLDHPQAGMQEWPLRSYLELWAVPASVRIARSHAKAIVREWRLEALVDTVELIVSEISTNAVRASADIAGQRDENGQAPDTSRIRLWLTSDCHSVLIQVWDGDHRHPVVQDPLSAQYGCAADIGQDGKIVWAVCCREAGAVSLPRRRLWTCSMMDAESIDNG